jgi:hypothetical protein
MRASQQTGTGVRATPKTHSVHGGSLSPQWRAGGVSPLKASQARIAHDDRLRSWSLKSVASLIPRGQTLRPLIATGIQTG